MRWPVVELDTIKSQARYSLVGGPFGSNLTTRDYTEAGVPIIRGVNLPDSAGFLDDSFVFVSDRKADQLLANNAYPGDIVFTQRGTLGQVGVIPNDAKYSRYVISQSQMKLTVDEKKAYAPFVYYFFRLKTTIEMIKAHTITSGVPHINLGMLKGFEIPLPPVGVQKQISLVASSYDDLIAANQRRIQLLEESAHLLYREWFVKLRFPGYETVPETKGEVPEGWSYDRLDAAFMLQRGFDLPASDRVDGDIPIFASTGIAGYHNLHKVLGPGVVTGRSGTLGEVHFVHENFWPLNTALWVKEFKRVTPLIAYFMLSSLDLTIYNAGASVPSLDRKTVHAIDILIPGEGIQILFDQAVMPLFEQIRTISKVNSKLMEARDMLLPKLMSGALDVSRITVPKEVEV